MSASLHVPKALKAQSTEALSEKLLILQNQEGGKIRIIAIVQDLSTKEWVCWYYPLRNLGGDVM